MPSAVVSASDRAYLYALLDPSPGATNRVLEAGQVLGIEVTVPDLAKRCKLGNLDPQHSGSGDRTAIEEATNCSPPARGSLLVTIRPDLDSVGAMAMIELRAAGLLDAGVCERAARIADADAHRRGPWPGPSTEQGTPWTDLSRVAAVAIDSSLALDTRVDLIAEWLRTGFCPGPDSDSCTHKTVGDTKAELSPSGRVAVVRSNDPHALRVGYELRPVVVAENPSFSLSGSAPYRKLTVAQFDPGWVDLAAVVADLDGREAGWGGSKTICGSPQGVASRLPVDSVVSTVERHLTARCVAERQRIDDETL